MDRSDTLRAVQDARGHVIKALKILEGHNLIDKLADDLWGDSRVYLESTALSLESEENAIFDAIKEEEGLEKMKEEK